MKRSVLLLVFNLFMLTACNRETKQNTATATLSGNVSTNGSTSMEKVIGTLSEQFMSDNPEVIITYEPTGSASGIEAVKNGQTDIGLSSGALKDSELRNNLKEETLTLDGIAIIVHKDNPVDNLSIEEIADIFKADIATILLLAIILNLLANYFNKKLKKEI